MYNYQNGHLAEYMAMWFLRFRGYRLLFQNYRCGKGTHAGEVDLIMLKKKTVVFIEVKQRQTLEKAAYAVLPPQKKRIRRAAEAFRQLQVLLKKRVLYCLNSVHTGIRARG